MKWDNHFSGCQSFLARTIGAVAFFSSLQPLNTVAGKDNIKLKARVSDSVISFNLEKLSLPAND